MKMLRDWNGDSNKLIYDILEQFGITPDKISIFKYEALTPDSFIWFFNMGNSRYCLYAEDYVPSIEHAQNQIQENAAKWNPNDKFKLLEVKQRKTWENSSPVNAADTYKPPEKPEEFMKYATTSGFDFVFLGKNTTKPKSNLD